MHVCVCACMRVCVCVHACMHACVYTFICSAACGTNFLCLNYSGSRRQRWTLSRLPWGPRVRQGCHPRASWCWAEYDPLQWARACHQHIPCPRQCFLHSSSRCHHTSWAACPLCRPPSSQVGWRECFSVAAAAVCLVMKYSVNLMQEIWVSLLWWGCSSHKSCSTHSAQCVQYFCFWTLLVFGIVNVHTDVDACSCTHGRRTL